MPLWNLSYEKVEELEHEAKTKRNLLVKTQEKTIKEMWTEDLDEFLKELEVYEEEEENNRLLGLDDIAAE